MANHFEYMQRALALAANGRGRTAPNPLVGAVIVKDGQIVGEGWHRVYGGPHAEVEALTAAKDQARGATMYVTLEPCAHYGKTPPCTEAIIKAGISRVLVAMPEPSRVARGGAEILRQAGIVVESGLCEAEATRLNRFFLHYVRNAKPYVIAKCAMTLDGYIATRSYDSKWITNETARRRAHALRHEVSAILVGAGTVKQDNPSLTARFEADSPDPVRLVLAPHADVDPKANVFTVASDAKGCLIVRADIDDSLLEPYLAAGVEVLKIPPAKDGALDLNALLLQLGEKGLTSLLVEGGSATLGHFFQAGVVNECRFFIAPKILGGQGLPVTSGRGPALISDAKKFYRTETEILDGDVLISVYDTSEV